MENNVLGLKVTRTIEGYAEVLTLNGQECWSKYTRDLRQEFGNIANFENGTSVLMLDRAESSWLLSVSIPIPGRDGDNVCGWINVPYNLKISGQELGAVVESVRKELVKNKRDEDFLKELFSKTYGTRPARKPLFESSGDKVAYRLYGRGQYYNLAELLGKLDQSYYQGYKSIFFIDSESPVRIKTGDDLSDRKLLAQVRIDPPRKTDDGFAPYIKGQPFTSPVYAMEGDKIEIVWERNGYKDIVRVQNVSADMAIDYPIFSEYKRLIPYRNFMVTDEKGKPVQEYHLSINDVELREGSELPVSEAAVGQCKVQVCAEDYEDFVDLLDLSHHHRINLKKKIYTYKFEVPAEHNYISFEYKSYKCLNQSPLKGYVPERSSLLPGQTIRLKYSRFDKKFWITILVAAVVVLCAGVFIGASLPDTSSSKKAEQEQEVPINDNRGHEAEAKESKVKTNRSDESPEEPVAGETPVAPAADEKGAKDASSGESYVKENAELPKVSEGKYETDRDEEKPDSDTKNQRTDQEKKSEDTKRGNDMFNYERK